MQPGAVEKKHLTPLLDFLRFAMQSGRSDVLRFPKRMNGSKNIDSDSVKTEEDEDDPFDGSDSGGPMSQNCSTSNRDTSLTPLAGTAVPSVFATETVRKRERSCDESHRNSVSNRSSIECEMLVKSGGKGQFTANYVDLSLDLLGMDPLCSERSRDSQKKNTKVLRGMECCYLLLGTSLVVTGSVIDINLQDDLALVCPDRGVEAGLEWVPVDRLFKIPKNIAAVREEVTIRVQKIVDAARRGDVTPVFSPMSLKDEPIDSDFQSSPMPDGTSEKAL